MRRDQLSTKTKALSPERSVVRSPVRPKEPLAVACLGVPQPEVDKA